MTNEQPLLKVDRLNVHYGSIHAIREISLEVNKGEIVSILGANGAGKTTTLRTISGLLKASGGDILFKGESIKSLAAHKIVGRGISQSPEGRMVFPDLTVLENLEMGAFLRKDKIEIAKDLEYTYELFPRLKERQKQFSGTLSGGEQQMLAIARAIMSRPEMILLDEPSLGIAPILVQAIFHAIKDINRKGMTVLLVEQNAFAALKISNRAYVMETGAITLSGNAKELMENDDIKEAYLGV